MLCGWFKKPVPLSQPFKGTCETKTNRDTLTLVFPCFVPATCICFEFWLVLWIVCVLSDWPEWLLWFWFYAKPKLSTLLKVKITLCGHSDWNKFLRKVEMYFQCSFDVNALYSYACDMINFIFFVLTSNSEDQSRLAARKYARVVQKLGFPVSYTSSLISSLISYYWWVITWWALCQWKEREKGIKS